MSTRLEKSILCAIAYFDVFDYPLSLVEILKYSFGFLGSLQKPSLDLATVKNALENSEWLKNKIKFKNGFYFLNKREKITTTRHKRYIISKKKFARAVLMAKILKHAPFVLGIFASNTISYWNAKKESDIDFVIITKKGGIWWARALCLGILSVLKMRPNNKSKLDKICLSVFAGQDRIDFEKYKISKNDIDYIFWVANFYPIFASEKIWDKFYSANSSWICAFVPATQKTSSHPMMETCSTGFIKSLFEIILKPFSKIPEIMQKAKFPSKIKEMANKDSRVRIEKEFLKFHVNDKRIYHLEKFVRRYKSAITEQD